MDKQFDKVLLDLIRKGHNDEANAMLNAELAQAAPVSEYDPNYRWTLLHHAAMHNNAVTARRLIELGADVNRLEGCRMTPLTRAVEYSCVAVVQVLLEANARIDILDEDGISALRLGLDSYCVDSETFKLLARKLRTEAGTNDEVAEMLIRAGCNMFHAATLRDIDVMECMLKRGVDVNSKDPTELTALHVAAKLNDVNLADWLLNNGADIDACDGEGLSASTISVESGNKTMLQFLLERGAYPDVRGGIDYPKTPLYTAFLYLDERRDESLECAELLLQHGVTLPDSENLLEMFHFALESPCYKAAKLLVAHLAMLEILGKPVSKSLMHSVDSEHRAKMSKLGKYYDSCQRVLMTNVFEDLSLMNLLIESDRKIKRFVRRETFSQRMKKFSSEYKLRESYSYYYNKMMRCLAKPSRMVQLENDAIPVICRIFKTSCNYFYFFARSVVECLNGRDLENLIQV